MIDIIGLLSTDGYIIYNKKLAKLYGIESAVLIGELCAEHCYYSKTNNLTEDGGFYSTQDNIEANTTLNSYAQRKAMKVLQDANIVKVKRIGLPARNYYYINNEQLLNIFSEDFEDPNVKSLNTEKSRSSNFKELDLQNLNINNNKINNNKINKSSNTTSNSSNTKNNFTETGNYSAKINTTKDKSVSENEFDFGIQNNKSRKPNLYDKCLALIDNYTNDSELRDLLIQYLNLTLEIKDNKLYANQWKGLLNKLSNLSNDISEQKLIVRTSIEKGWRSFYLPKNDFNNNRSVDNVVIDTDDSVNHDKAKNPDGTLRYF